MTANALFLGDDNSFLRLHPTSDGQVNLSIGDERVTVSIKLSRRDASAIRDYLKEVVP